jgi:hypothetical protein
MSLTIGQKCVRVLKFLRGIRRPRTFGALAAHGFDEPDLEEGWSLLRAASGAKLDMPAVVPLKADIYDQLDALENMWFPICRAVLERHHPPIAERVFLNLRQTSGLEVSVSMSTFVARVRELEASERQAESEARALLERRGLTEAVMGQAESLLRQLEVKPIAPTVSGPSAEDVAAAERAMWGWYMEWSVVARKAIHDRRLLRSLGFLTASGTVVPDDEPTEEDPIDDEKDLEASDYSGAQAAE